MRFAVLWLVLTATAANADPLAARRTELLDGHLSVRLPPRMIVTGSRAILDTGQVRFSLEALELHHVSAGTLHERVAGELAMLVGPGLAVERLQLAEPWTGFAVVPRFPRRVGERALVLAAYAANTDGAIEIIELFVDDAGLDGAARWAELGRRIAGTMILGRVPGIEVVPRTPSEDPELPAGWKITDIEGGLRFGRRAGARGHCDVKDNELDAKVLADTQHAKIVGGTLRGHDMYWTEWTDDNGTHAEAMLGASRWGTFHLVCHAASAKGLSELRRVIEVRFARPRPREEPAGQSAP